MKMKDKEEEIMERNKILNEIFDEILKDADEPTMYMRIKDNKMMTKTHEIFLKIEKLEEEGKEEEAKNIAKNLIELFDVAIEKLDIFIKEIERIEKE